MDPGPIGRPQGVFGTIPLTSSRSYLDRFESLMLSQSFTDRLPLFMEFILELFRYPFRCYSSLKIRSCDAVMDMVNNMGELETGDDV
jgi:hypothetical protein